MIRLLLSLLLFAIGSSLSAQQLKRVDEGIKYRASEVKGSLLAEDWTGWKYNTTEHKWEGEKGRTVYCDSDLLTIIVMPISLQVRHIEVDGDTMSILHMSELDGHYEYSTIKEGYHSNVSRDFYLVDGRGVATAILDHVQKIEETTEETYSPGVKNFYFKTKSYSSPGKHPLFNTDSTDFDNLARGLKSKEPTHSIDNIGLTVFPVKVDGEVAVRFMFTKSTNSYPRICSPECFDQAYYEIGLEKFKAFIQSIE